MYTSLNGTPAATMGDMAQQMGRRIINDYSLLSLEYLSCAAKKITRKDSHIFIFIHVYLSCVGKKISLSRQREYSLSTNESNRE
jgi:hypothetical protein